MDVFQIRLLGELSITYGEKQIQNSDNRSRKVWLLLAYMIYFRQNNITSDELIDLLWNNEDGSSNPSNALKTIFHRLRNTLDLLGDGMGRKLIIRRNGGYAFNTEIPMELDIIHFEEACNRAKAESDPTLRLASFMDAMEVYRGDFLPKLSGETWVLPVQAYYHNLYVQAAHETLSLLADAKRSSESIWLCHRAIELEPYDESLHIHLMRQLLNMGEQQSAVLVYETLSQTLFSQFGVTPSEELRILHREAIRSTGQAKLDIQSVMKDLLNTEEPGALYCEYDFFKVIFSAVSRSVGRSGVAAHIALLSITSANGGPLSKRSLARCMDNLQILICDLLRRGDVVSRCSISQFIILLPNANYENSCIVMDRILRQFGRKYPHSPAFLRFSVQPLTPT